LGVGWAPGTIGQVFGIDVESPAGYAFQTGQMVISNHLQVETRFRTPKLLSDHGIGRAINVLIARGGEVSRARRRVSTLDEALLAGWQEDLALRLSAVRLRPNQ
jgi:hypothetical protein